MSKFDTSWFDLKNYAALEELDIKGWCHQFRVRQRLTVMLNQRNVSMSHEDLMAFIYKIDTAVQAIKDIPIRPVEEFIENDVLQAVKSDLKLAEKVLHFVKETDFEKVKEQIGFISPIRTVSSMGLSSLYKLSKKLKHTFPAYEAYQSMNVTDAEMVIANTPIDLLSHEAGTTKRYAHLHIDMNATDQQLEHDFKQWLLEYRKYLGRKIPEKNVNAVMINKWIAQRILQYMDLKLLAQFENKKISVPTIAKLLFPQEYLLPEDSSFDPVRRINDTISKNAKSILCDDFLNALEEQARAMSK